MPTELIRTTLLALALLALKTSEPPKCTAKMCTRPASNSAH
jgi:hypothetical protein